MTINLSDLSVLAYANHFTLWHYKCRTKEEYHTTKNNTNPEFWTKAADMMSPGDAIYIQFEGSLVHGYMNKGKDNNYKFNYFKKD